MSGAETSGAAGPETEPVLILDPALIDVPEDRLRAVDPDRVAEMVESFKQTGQLAPIQVRQHGARYVLNIGAHRHAAAVILAPFSLRATLTDGSADKLRLEEIDENLFRAELTPYDRAAFLAERRAIFERMNGTVRPGRRGRAGNSDNLSQLSFFDDVTSKFGLPRRMIERSLKLKSALSDEIWRALRGHPVTRNGSELEKLAKLHETIQRRVVRLLMLGENPAKNVSAALRSMSDRPVESVDERQFRRLAEAWDKAGAKARKDFWLFLQREGHAVTEAGGEFPS